MTLTLKVFVALISFTPFAAAGRVTCSGGVRESPTEQSAICTDFLFSFHPSGVKVASISKHPSAKSFSESFANGLDFGLDRVPIVHVAEPGTISLLGIVLLGISLVVRAKRMATKSDAKPAGDSVPSSSAGEPANCRQIEVGTS